MKEKKERNKLTPVKAIRKYCMWCMIGSSEEIKNCTSGDECILFIWRYGKRPTTKKRLTPIKTIRKKCINCSETYEEIKTCEENDCPLHVYRMGKRPIVSTQDI